MSSSNKQVIAAIANSISTGIEAEINQQRHDANDRIGAREVARSYINDNLSSMPELVTGEYIVSYLDNRGEKQSKVQSKNLAVWCVVLQTTIETGHTTEVLLASILMDWAKDEFNEEWDKKDTQTLCLKFIEHMRDLWILSDKRTTIQYVDEEGETQTGKVTKLCQSFLELMMDITKHLRSNSHMLCRPLVNQPMDWTDNLNGVGTNAGLKLIKGNPATGDAIAQPVLDAVNTLQAVKFIVAPAMIDTAYDLLDNADYETVEEERMYTEITLPRYEKESFFFPVTMDSRGRMYYRGGLLTPQGTDFCKAAFQFAESMPLGSTGLDAICLHVANCLGHDKLSYNDRLACIEQYIDCGDFDAINDHIDVATRWPKSDVFQATVAILELKRILLLIERGDAVCDIQSNLVCHQDGTCNGLQHMSAITRNYETAKTVNCTASTHDDDPLDIYGIVATEATKSKALSPEAVKLMMKYGRSMAKDGVMITGYGAGEVTVQNGVYKFLVSKHENGAVANEIGKAYVEAMQFKAAAVKTLTKAVKSRVESALEFGREKFQWTTADGFVATTEYRDLEVNRVRAGVFNALVRNMHPLPLDEIKSIGAMAPNFIHSIDATHLRMVVNGCGHDLVTIHDSIGSHAATYFDTATVIRKEFVAVHEYDALENLCKNMGVGSNQVRTPKFRGTYDINEALESSYIFS